MGDRDIWSGGGKSCFALLDIAASTSSEDPLLH